MGKIWTLFMTKVKTEWAVGLISSTLLGPLQEQMAGVNLGEKHRLISRTKADNQARKGCCFFLYEEY